MKTLLFEIGAEEIPAGYIEPALDALSSQVLKKLTDARIGHGSARVFGTPRRLALEVADVAEMQESVTVEVMGPPEKVGFDENGAPKVPAEKFAEKAGVAVGELKIKETPKGRYLCAEVTEPALETPKILADALPEIMTRIPFPKTMKWGSLHVAFARPVHWIVALLGETVIPFTFGDIESGNRTYGHRFLSPEAIEIRRPDEYADKLREAGVIADLDERRQMLVTAVNQVAAEMGGEILPDEALVDTVKNLVEYPAVVAGKFDAEFLEVPDEVLITAMREHQKYFAVADSSGKLMPGFIVANNTRAKDMSLVATGHERVLRARLSDAQFFFRGDADTAMEAWVEKLKKVLFQAKLGSVHEKVIRVRQLAEYLADEIGPEGGDLKQKASRAAWLCKADLVSQVVIEFTKLQGVMGRIYAGMAGEDAEVATAIEEHYRPTYSGGPLPETLTGAIVAIADKMDSICGCFSVGLIPTGGADPYALRRQGIGVLQILHEKGFSFSLTGLIEKSVSLFADKSDRDAGETVAGVYDFLKNRVAHILEDEGFSRDVIVAVADVTVDHVPHVWDRVGALEKLKAEPDFEPLAIAFKRIVNIIRKSEVGDIPDTVDEALFEDATESGLYAAFQEVAGKVRENLVRGAFDQALLDIASLKGPVDRFFDDVMVMAEDEKLRNNRLALLRQMAEMFGQFADFSKIST
ncbi:glycine--tRNA ligase subunit beta [Desulfonema ishimotonii]|uniref:Glycine--tRNA ligase beta subunit n=1 Tax=Desulfonema ishimotonii TaxID=45657 RepID=A0A401G4K2_9BACT|nr:glycine--tRNA ligase subunit beta [Desulfonema ishimotonii]GBC64113.1 glycine--tRNA ligase subunit beta [Desulfonema ishimotonii]